MVGSLLSNESDQTRLQSTTLIVLRTFSSAMFSERYASDWTGREGDAGDRERRMQVVGEDKYQVLISVAVP